MNHTLVKINDNLVKLTVTIPKDKVADEMIKAAKHLSTVINIPGFRPGTASYDIVKQKLGAMKILEEAAENLIRASFASVMLDEDLDTIGAPHFTVEVMIPDQDLIYSAEIALMPKIKHLADYHQLEIKAQSTEPTEEIINQAKTDLARMQTKETRALAGHIITKGDKAVVNLTMKKDNVVLEGGESQNHGVYTHESHYIDGFVEQILGLAEGAEKTFTLKFPAEHYQKHLANSDIDFTVRINEIYTLEIPSLDDEFAKRLGLENAALLEEKLKDNLKLESDTNERRRQERECLDLLAQKSEFDTIPDLLVNQEIDRMINELEHSIGENNLELSEYLKSINKSVDELKLDFTPTAITRVKVALIIRHLAKTENVTVDATIIDAELDKIATNLGDNKEYKDRIYEPEYRDFVESQLRNRIVVDHILSVMVK